ncbi:phosphate ABC transporter membrane protein 2 (PhoT family) [Melghiribacillus thermohalophilus]|uniref:Phosphate transport system permease protein PstA n=1 Tax=Melghiribacillus thermohalophilus TaxID=1324956 RepID=A0A4R3NHM4_9BACI|nr:phosphate ABC transporter permease PstA [Melghiribacillus thermohalophilus]TCT26978.1 phosphate ABC transporter membrane protein 2 (PhoT family) [Melghiribacillus thermohalophilus]
MNGFMSKEQWKKRLNRRILVNRIFYILFFAATTIGLIFLAMLLYRVLTQGLGCLNMDFIKGFPAPYPDEAGIYAGIVGSIYLIAIVAPVSLVLGVSTAIYLEEYAPKNRISRFIQSNIQNLAGVPSIVFGLLGLTFFVYMMGFGYSLLAGGLTMSLLVLPIIVVAAQEAIRSVPNELKEASYGMGATKWQTIVRVVLPASVPGILTGSILALSRAIGETAPLLIVGAAAAIYTLPDSVFGPYTAMPIQIYSWISRPGEEWPLVAAAGIIVLLAVLLLMNAVAVIIRNKFQKRY